MPGKLIVIDGTDGTGKATQTGRLVERLRGAGIPADSRAFPRHGHPSAWFVDEYLRGAFGPANAVPATLASTFYALDRYAAAPDLRAALDAGTTLVLDRYVSANAGHQAAKLADPTERAAFVQWVEELEYGTCALPRPDLNLLLHLDPALAKDAQQRARKLLDLHERDDGHLRAAERAFLEVAAREGWVVVECAEGRERLSVDAVSNLVWAAVAPLFPTS